MPATDEEIKEAVSKNLLAQTILWEIEREKAIFDQAVDMSVELMLEPTQLALFDVRIVGTQECVAEAGHLALEPCAEAARAGYACAGSNFDLLPALAVLDAQLGSVAL